MDKQKATHDDGSGVAWAPNSKASSYLLVRKNKATTPCTATFEEINLNLKSMNTLCGTCSDDDGLSLSAIN